MEDKVKISFSDVYRVWYMQRIMRGLPTEYQMQDITEFQANADETIKTLGLTDLDFEDDRAEETYKKLRKYFENK